MEKTSGTSSVSFPCPSCNEILSFRRDYLSLIDNIELECPSCKSIFKGKELISSGNSAPADALIGVEVIENYADERGGKGETGMFYKLLGERTSIGRKSSSSKAQIQIPSNRYMSRNHIEIYKKDSDYFVRIASATNPPEVNGKIIEPEDSIRLNHGDSITLGQCRLKWINKIIDNNKSMLL